MYTNLPVIRTPRGGQVSHTTGASRLSLSGCVLFVMCKRAEVIPEGAKLPSPAAAVACTKLFGGRSYVFCNESTDKKPSEPLSGGDCFACQVMDA